MKDANWITGGSIFRKEFIIGKDIKNAKLAITAKGVYVAYINGRRVGGFILAPGYTSYNKRHQYQEYDVSGLLKSGANTIDVWVGGGWYNSGMNWTKGYKYGAANGIIAELDLDGEKICTDGSWLCCKSPVISDSIYDGERYDARIEPVFCKNAEILDEPKSNLIPQEGEIVAEQERLTPANRFKTPKGEDVIDFGQNLTGYVEFTVTAKAGDKIVLSHAEILDGDGSFYTENLRGAAQRIEYICRDGVQTWKPRFTFMGFRYVRIDEAPDPENIELTAIAVYSDMKRTGYFESSDKMLNKFFENALWGQKSNFLDIPTDCPQRDERLGWTGDAQIFMKAASYNYDTERFFVKWLGDLAADQFEDGNVPMVIPDSLPPHEVFGKGSAAWGDAAVICPWRLYTIYGNRDILGKQFESMKKWTYFNRPYADYHLGDWLALDDSDGDYTHSTRKEFVGRAYSIYSTGIVIKAGRILGEDVSEFVAFRDNAVMEFNRDYPYTEYYTQAEHVLALHFDIAPDKPAVAKALADKIAADGGHLTTGFVGAAYLLHALSDNGYTELAYDLLLRKEYPSWFYPITMGATTVWERWNGIKPDGTYFAADMNSFNHYAFGTAVDWLYEVAAGIKADESEPGFENIIIKPVTDGRFDYLGASVETRFGRVSSKWTRKDGGIAYEIEVPTKAEIVIGGETHKVGRGSYEFHTD